VTVLGAHADLYGKQVFYCTNNYNIAVYYINTCEIPGFFPLLKNHIFIAFREDIYIIDRPKPDTDNMFIFFSWGKLAYKWVCLRNVEFD